MINLIRRFGRLIGLNSVLHKLLFGKDYEKHFDSAIFSFCKPGCIVFDIGANHGHYISKFVDIGAIVYAFEPDPHNFAVLQEKFKGNQNVHLLNAAIGSRVEKVRFKSFTENNGVNSRVSADGDIEIDCYTLDHFCEHNSVLPDIVKIDVEGYELEVLDGCDKVADNANVLAIEIHNEVLNNLGVSNPNQYIRILLSKWGYKTRFTDFSHIIGWKE